MKQLIKLSILFLVSMPCLIYGQDTTKCDSEYFTDSLLQKLTGNWIATGTVGGDEVVYKFSVQWVLNHQFLELVISDTAAKPEYTAKVFIGYDCTNDRYVVHWIDNFGGQFSETLGYGKRNDQLIEILFEYPDGHMVNSFSYNQENDSWISYTTSKGKNGKWTTFGDIHLKRNR
jgi:hypothetical protein